MIIISKKKSLVPLLFVHMPKTAGGSIKDYFGKTSNNLKEKNKVSFGHNNLSSIKNKICNNKHLNEKISFKDYFKFVIFRNPWERILSEFVFRSRDSILKKKNKSNKRKYWIDIKEKKYNFKEWISYITETENITDLIKKYSCYSFVELDGKVGVDYIINFHNLNEDFNLIKKISNNDHGELNKEGMHVHKSNHDFFKNYYDDKTIELVKKIHEKDISLFKFSFDDYKYINLDEFQNKEKIKKLTGRKAV
jgi:hypothetical protein